MIDLLIIITYSLIFNLIKPLHESSTSVPDTHLFILIQIWVWINLSPYKKFNCGKIDKKNNFIYNKLYS